MERQERTGGAVRTWEAESLPGEAGEGVLDLQTQLQGEPEPRSLGDLPEESLARGAVQEFAGEGLADLQEARVENRFPGGRSRGGVPLEVRTVAGAVQLPKLKIGPVAEATGLVLRPGLAVLVDLDVGHGRAADPQPASHRTFGPEGGVRTGKDAGRRTGLPLEGGNELAESPFVLGAVGGAEVYEDAAREERGKVGVLQKDRDQPKLLLDGQRYCGGVLLQHPGPGEGCGCNAESDIAGLAKGLIQLVDENVPGVDSPLVQEDLQAGVVEVLGQAVDLFGVRVGVGEEDVVALGHPGLRER
ncbi:MAG TPA: hypothetical protein VJ725_05885 [Thermoanaerobaculia bacterium]|nr:hypothetical protein [Thermoanaerobaculia bacterium]